MCFWGNEATTTTKEKQYEGKKTEAEKASELLY